MTSQYTMNNLTTHIKHTKSQSRYRDDLLIPVSFPG